MVKKKKQKQKHWDLEVVGRNSIDVLINNHKH